MREAVWPAGFQRRRRHSSLHYHGTIVMLKKQKEFLAWILRKDLAQQKALCNFAFKEGQQLRKKHKDAEREHLTLQENELEAMEMKKKRKAERNATQAAKTAQRLLKKAKKTVMNHIINMPAVVPKPQVHDWVAVSYDKLYRLLMMTLS
jgi:hypothetical protein